jgi:hypothetical protein
MIICEGITQYGCMNKLRLRAIPLVKPDIDKVRNHIQFEQPYKILHWIWLGASGATILCKGAQPWLRMQP